MPKVSPHSETIGQCSNVLRLVGAAQSRAQIFKKEICNLKDHVNNLMRTVSMLAPQSHLSDSGTLLDKQPGDRQQLPWRVASETLSRINRLFKAIVFDIFEHIPMNGLRDSLLNTGDMAYIPYLTMRLMKQTESDCCPVKLQL